MDKLYKQITELKNWDLNPRDIDETSYGRLKDQLSLKGQFYPLLITEDGTVLGGNMRLKAMNELNFQRVWVTIISFIQKENGMWYAVFDGTEQLEPFPTKEDAMMNWSLAHNADYGHYDFEKFANIEPNYSIDWNNFAVNFDKPSSIQDVIDSIAPENPDDKQFKRTIIITLDSEEKQKELYSQLTQDGYNAKIKTTLAKGKI